MWYILATNQEIKSSESIELVRLGVSSPSDWVLSLGYALAHGFNEIHVDNIKYHRIAREVVYIEPSTEQNKPRYLVTQSPASAWDRIKLVSLFSATKISILDRKTGKIILSWAAPISGWPGDKTAQKIAEINESHQRT